MTKAEEMVKYAVSLCPEVEFSAEDATRSSTDFLAKIFDKIDDHVVVFGFIINQIHLILNGQVRNLNGFDLLAVQLFFDGNVGQKANPEFIHHRGLNRFDGITLV